MSRINPNQDPVDELILCPECDGRGKRRPFEDGNGHLQGPDGKYTVDCRFCSGSGKMIKRTKVTYFRIPKKLAPMVEGCVRLQTGPTPPEPKECPNGRFVEKEKA